MHGSHASYSMVALSMDFFVKLITWMDVYQQSFKNMAAIFFLFIVWVGRKRVSGSKKVFENLGNVG